MRHAVTADEDWGPLWRRKPRRNYVRRSWAHKPRAQQGVLQFSMLKLLELLRIHVARPEMQPG